MKQPHYHRILQIYHLQVLLAVLALTDCLSVQDSSEILRAATIVFRHGDRNPIMSYSGDPYSNETIYWPEGYGALTLDGKVRLYNLGRFLRRRYPTFQRKNVQVFASARNRTITSAMANLAGFYGQNRSFLKHIDTFNPTGLGVNVIPQSEDNFIMLDQPCPKYTKLYHEHYNRTRPMQKYQDALRIINEKVGLNFSVASPDVVVFADTILIQKSRHLKLPDWLEELYNDGVFHEIREEWFSNIAPTPLTKRLLAGAMVQRFINDMDIVVANDESSTSPTSLQQNDSPKITLISGHDKTLVAWLISMGVYDWDAPDFGAALFLELYQRHGISSHSEFIIKVFYKKESDKDPIPILIPGCGNPCRYSKLKTLLQPITVTDRGKECAISEGRNTNTNANKAPATTKGDSRLPMPTPTRATPTPKSGGVMITPGPAIILLTLLILNMINSA